MSTRCVQEQDHAAGYSKDNQGITSTAAWVSISLLRQSNGRVAVGSSCKSIQHWLRCITRSGLFIGRLVIAPPSVTHKILKVRSARTAAHNCKVCCQYGVLHAVDECPSVNRTRTLPVSYASEPIGSASERQRPLLAACLPDYVPPKGTHAMRLR